MVGRQGGLEKCGNYGVGLKLTISDPLLVGNVAQVLGCAHLTVFCVQPEFLHPSVGCSGRPRILAA